MGAEGIGILVGALFVLNGTGSISRIFSSYEKAQLCDIDRQEVWECAGLLNEFLQPRVRREDPCRAS